MTEKVFYTFILKYNAFIQELPFVKNSNTAYIVQVPDVILPNDGSLFRSLCYLVRVPVAVEDNHRVCALQVEPETPRPGAQKEDKVLRLRIVKHFQEHAAVLSFGGTYV